MIIKIGAKSHAGHMVKAMTASHIVRIGPNKLGALRFPHLPKENILNLSDVSGQHVTRDHVGALIAFFENLPEDARVFIHCLNGMTRSSAAAIIALCAVCPDVPAFEHYQTMLKLAQELCRTGRC